MNQCGCPSAFYNLQAFTPSIILFITPLLMCVLSYLNFLYVTHAFSTALTYDPYLINRRGLSMYYHPIQK